MLNEHLEHQVNRNLLADQDLSSQRIDVAADAGVVTLSGNVQSYRRKLAAQEIAMATEHVQQVRNEILVSTPDQNSTTQIAEIVNETLDHSEGLRNESIMVSVKDEVITLTGYVRSEAEKTRVSDVAHSVDRVRDINNFLIVNSTQVTHNIEHCATVLQSIASIIGLRAENLRLSVVNESARLSGRVDAIWMKEAAETTVRKFGILTVANHLTVDSPRS
jgi:osmotically-inducible protein OsmY